MDSVVSDYFVAIIKPSPMYIFKKKHKYIYILTVIVFAGYVECVYIVCMLEEYSVVILIVDEEVVEKNHRPKN